MSNFLRKFTLILLSSILSFSLAFADDAVIPTSSPDPEIIPQVSFSDIKEENPNYVPILEIAKAGYISGYDDGTFRSGEAITRAAALKIIMGLLEIYDADEDTSKSKPFEDVDPESWYASYITQAKEKKITNGYEDGTFKPDNLLTLGEALKLIVASIPNYQPATVEEAPFADVPQDIYYASYATYAKEREMLDISPKNTISPDQNLTRGQFSALIYKLKASGEGYNFGKATFYGAAVQGSGTASGERFDMNQFTAAHKTLPFGTIVEVTNLANGKSVQVRITDRGPYGPGRSLDLTSSAFKEISTLSRGVINIQYRVVSEPTT